MHALKSPMPQVMSNTILARSLRTSPSSVLVTGILSKASHMVLIFVI